MVSSAKGTFYRRADNKYLIYVPKDLAEDSNFPFPLKEAGKIKVTISFSALELGGQPCLIIKKATEET